MNYKPIIVNTAYKLYQKENGLVSEEQAINQVCTTLNSVIGYKASKQDKEYMTKCLKEKLKGF